MAIMIGTDESAWRRLGPYVLCIRNDGFPASLELLKLYRTRRDPEGEAMGRVRVVDETGDDYLYPREYFVPVQMPERLLKALESLDQSS